MLLHPRSSTQILPHLDSVHKGKDTTSEAPKRKSSAEVQDALIILEYRRASQGLANENAQFKKENERLRRELAGIQGANEVLRKDLQSAKEENQKLYKGNELLKQYLRSVNEKDSKLRQENKTLVSENMHLKESVQKQTKKIGEISKENEILQEEKKAMEEKDVEISKLKAKIDRTENDVEQLSAKSKMLEKENIIFQQTIDIRNNIITNMKRVNKTLEDERTRLVKTVVATIERNKLMKEKLTAVELEKEDTEENLTEAVSKCAILKGHLRYEIFERSMMTGDFQEEIKNLKLFIKEEQKSVGDMKRLIQAKDAKISQLLYEKEKQGVNHAETKNQLNIALKTLSVFQQDTDKQFGHLINDFSQKTHHGKKSWLKKLFKL